MQCFVFECVGWFQIWSSQTALLLATCRGHEGEVTDLAVNICSSVVASGNNDTTIRCWNLQVCMHVHALVPHYPKIKGRKHATRASLQRLFCISSPTSGGYVVLEASDFSMISPCHFKYHCYDHGYSCVVWRIFSTSHPGFPHLSTIRSGIDRTGSVPVCGPSCVSV